MRAALCLVPVGSNVGVRTRGRARGEDRTVVVFGVTENNVAEATRIAHVVRTARRALPDLALRVMGRGAQQSMPVLQRELDRSGVRLSVHGVVAAREVALHIADSDVLLFLRGGASSRRGTIAAAIACGTPIVAERGPETSSPITEAGLELVRLGDECRSCAIVHIVEDQTWSSELSCRNRGARPVVLMGKHRNEDHRVAAVSSEATRGGEGRARVLMVSTHPIQYAAPQYRRLAADERVELTVLFLSMASVEGAVDEDFGRTVRWDVPLLEGFRWSHPPNRSPRPSVHRFFGLVNPGVWRLIRRARADVVVLYGYRAASFWIAWAAARASRASVVWTTDATTLDPKDRRSWKTWLKRRVLPWFSGREMRSSSHRVGGGGSCSRSALAPDRVHLTQYVVDNGFFAESCGLGRPDRNAPSVGRAEGSVHCPLRWQARRVEAAGRPDACGRNRA